MRRATAKILEHLVAARRITFEAALESASSIDAILAGEGVSAPALALFPEPAAPTGPVMEEKRDEASQAAEKKKRTRPWKKKKSTPLGSANMILGGLYHEGARTITRSEFTKRCARSKHPEADRYFVQLIDAGRLTESHQHKGETVYRIKDLDEVIRAKYNEGVTDIDDLARACLSSDPRVRDALEHLTAKEASGA